MGMTIKEAIKYYENKNVVLTEEEALANTLALNTMRKYQKIVDIVSLNDEEFKQCGLKELKEILEVIWE